MKKTLLCLTLAGLLSACGGSDNDSGSNQNPPPSNQTTENYGTFLNSSVDNVSYETSSGISGTLTEENKTFKYQSGDKVQFSISGVQIGGLVTAQDNISPADLFTDETAQKNLLSFIDALDSDPDTDGVQISDEILEKLKNIPSITFDQPFENFSTQISETNLLNDQVLVSPDEIVIKQQQVFYKDIAGTWQSHENNSVAVIHILTNGNYILGQASPKDAESEAGIELGSLQWNPLNNSFEPTITHDTNGTAGLSHASDDKPYTLSSDGTYLILHEPGANSTYKLTRVKQSSGLVGTWKFSETQLFAFFDNNYYFFLDGIGGDDCGWAGIEYGKYSITSNTLAVTEVLYDTNGCGGLHDTSDSAKVNATYSISGTSLTLHLQGEDTFTLQRSN